MRELDFLPPEFHRQRFRRRQRRRQVVYGGCVFAALLIMHFGNAARLKAASATLETLRGGVEHFEQVEKLTSRARDLRRELAVVSLLDDDAPIDALLAEQVRLMGDAMSLRWLKIERQSENPAADTTRGHSGPATEGNAGADSLLAPGTTHAVVRGVAASDVEVGTFLGRLAASPLFREVTLVFSRQHEEADRLMREFELQFTVNRVQDH